MRNKLQMFYVLLALLAITQKYIEGSECLRKIATFGINWLKTNSLSFLTMDSNILRAVYSGVNPAAVFGSITAKKTFTFYILLNCYNKKTNELYCHIPVHFYSTYQKEMKVIDKSCYIKFTT